MEVNVRNLVHGVTYRIEEISRSINRIFTSVFDAYEIDEHTEYLLWNKTTLEVTFHHEPFSKTIVQYDDMSMDIVHPWRKIFIV
jgi:hypothetical protein